MASAAHGRASRNFFSAQADETIRILRDLSGRLAGGPLKVDVLRVALGSNLNYDEWVTATASARMHGDSEQLVRVLGRANDLPLRVPLHVIRGALDEAIAVANASGHRGILAEAMYFSQHCPVTPEDVAGVATSSEMIERLASEARRPYIAGWTVVARAVALSFRCDFEAALTALQSNEWDNEAVQDRNQTYAALTRALRGWTRDVAMTDAEFEVLRRFGRIVDRELGISGTVQGNMRRYGSGTEVIDRAYIDAMLNSQGRSDILLGQLANCADLAEPSAIDGCIDPMLDIFEPVGDTFLAFAIQVGCLGRTVGRLYERKNDLDRALDWMELAADRNRRGIVITDLGSTLIDLARLYRAVGDRPGVERSLEEAESLIEPYGFLRLRRLVDDARRLDAR